MRRFLNKFFKIEERGSKISTEIVAGVIMFFAVLYILPVNTSLIHTSGMSEASIFTVTTFVMGLAAVILGLVVNRSLVMAPGAGMNAFFVYTLTVSLGYSWAEALTIVFVTAVIFFIVTISGLREKIVDNIPKDLKYAVSAALGLFLAFIGLNMGGIITSNSSTLVALGDLTNPLVLLSVFGVFLVLILTLTLKKNNKYALIISMLITAGVGFGLHLAGIENMPKFDFNLSLDFKNTFFVFSKNFNIFKDINVYIVIISALFVQVFDATGSFVAIGRDVGIIDEEGKLIDPKKVLITDSLMNIVAPIVGSPSSIIVAEGAIGAKSGAKTGLSSVVTGLLLFLTLLIYPIFSIFASINVNGVNYSPVATLALVYVGIMLFSNIKNIDFKNSIIVSSSFIIITMTIFTHSFVNGLGFGFLTYVLLMVFSGKYKEVHWVLYFISLFFIFGLVMEYLF